MALGASSIRYLYVVGAANRWIFFVFAVFAASILYVRAGNERTTTIPYFFCFIVPIAAGTGLLTAGRRGELDLLLGAGTTRKRLWWSALAVAWGIPVLMSVMLLILGGPPTPTTTVSEALLRLIPVLVFTGGVGFAAGLIELRYAAGVIWLLLRLIFLMTPPGMSTIVRLSKGIDLPSSGAILLTIVAAPETMLESTVPAPYVAVAGLAGLAALAAAFAWFQRAELGGKRQ